MIYPKNGFKGFKFWPKIVLKLQNGLFPIWRMVLIPMGFLKLVNPDGKSLEAGFRLKAGHIPPFQTPRFPMPVGLRPVLLKSP